MPDDVWPEWEDDIPPEEYAPPPEYDPPTPVGLSATQVSPAEVHHAAVAALAACDGGTGAELLDMVAAILGADVAVSKWSASSRRVWQRTAEVLRSAFADFTLDVVNFDDIPGVHGTPAAVHLEDVVGLLAEVAAARPQRGNPFARWAALCDRLRIDASAAAAANYAASASGATVEELLSAWRAIPAPASAPETARGTHTRTAAEWEAVAAAAAATNPPLRLSFGLPSLDRALTARGPNGEFTEPIGSIADGEFTVIAAATGNGKSALARPAAAALAQDLRNAGRRQDKVLVAITEESPTVVYTAAGLATGQPRHHLADQVVIANCGASRVRLIEAVWSLVVDAFEKSKATSRPVTECGLPRVIIWDYIGGTSEAGEPGDTVAMERNANLALRGLAGWNIDDMQTFTGQSFAEFAGMPWPEGMESWRPSVVAFAQFVKLREPTWYDPDNTKCQVADFVVDDADGAPAWQVRPGDFRVPTQAEVRGSGVLVNHATTLMILHRSRPARNAKIVDPDTGVVRLSDDRARILLVKTRNGAATPVVPMRFDSNPEGFRGQWYDPLGEALRAGGMQLAPGCDAPGAPVLPPRPAPRDVELVAY